MVSPEDMKLAAKEVRSIACFNERLNTTYLFANWFRKTNKDFNPDEWFIACGWVV